MTTIPVWLSERQQTSRLSWFWFRVLFKGLGLYVLCNVLFALFNPMPTLEQVTVYNTIVPRMERFPGGVTRLPVLFDSHVVANPKSEQEYRVLLLGDSATYGAWLNTDQMLSAMLNDLQLEVADGRIVRTYNLAYPLSSLPRDLLILDYAMRFEPDMVVWFVSPAGFLPHRIFRSPLLTENPEAMRDLIEHYSLNINPDDPNFKQTGGLLNSTLWGQRVALYNFIRLQIEGIVWGATGIDEFWSYDYESPVNDFDDNVLAYEPEGLDRPQPLPDDMWGFNVLAAGLERAGDTPVLVINSPMYISDGRNSDLRYNLNYPRWFYEDYRTRITDFVESHDMLWLDLWDTIPNDMFTDTAMHYSPVGSELLGEQVGSAIVAAANGEPLSPIILGR